MQAAEHAEKTAALSPSQAARGTSVTPPPQVGPAQVTNLAAAEQAAEIARQMAEQQEQARRQGEEAREAGAKVQQTSFDQPIPVPLMQELWQRQQHLPEMAAHTETPAGWTAAVDTQSGFAYYWHNASGHGSSQWEFPQRFAATTSATNAKADRPSHADQSLVDQKQDDRAKQFKQKATTDAAKANRTKLMEAARKAEKEATMNAQRAAETPADAQQADPASPLQESRILRRCLAYRLTTMETSSSTRTAMAI